MTRKARILIVDDEPDVLALLAELVRSFGHDAIAAPDAEAALSVVRRGEAVDVVITDLRLPGMNGIDLLSEIKRAIPSVPVIMLTAHCSVESFIQTQSRGIFEYINKPVRAAELRRIVQAAIASPPDGAGRMPAEA
jgi:two-component system response regulator GlrR